MKTKALVFLEGAEEIEPALQYFKDKEYEPIYVSCASQALFQLQNKHVSHINADDYADFKTLHDYTYKHFETLEAQNTVLDDLLAQEIPALKTHDIRPFDLNFIFIKTLLDTLQLRLALMRGVLNQYPHVSDFYVFKADINLERDFFFSHDRMNELILALIFPEHNYTVLEYERAKQNIFKEAPNKAEQKLERRLLLKRGLGKIRHILQSLQSKFNRKNTRSYQFKSLATSAFIPSAVLQELGIEREILAEKLPQNPLPLNTKSIEERIARSEAYKVLFADLPKTAAQMWWPWFEANIFKKIPAYLALAQEIDQKIQTDDVKFFESTSFFSAPSKIIAQQFRHHGRKVIGTHHGSLGTQLEKMFYFGGDLKYVTDYCVWGKGVQQYLEDYTTLINNTFNTIITGTQHYKEDYIFTKGELQSLLGIPKGQKIFLFAGVGFTQNLFYNFGLMYSDQEEFLGQQELLSFFANRSDVHLIYKGLKNDYMEEGHMSAYIASLKAKNITHLQSIRLKHLLPAVDGFIVDRPSTGMLEAQCFGVQVYAYNNKIEFPEGCEKLYKEQVYHFDSVSECTAQIEQNLEQGKKSKNTDSTNTYFDLYGCDKSVSYTEKLKDFIHEFIE